MVDATWIRALKRSQHAICPICESEQPRVVESGKNIFPMLTKLNLIIVYLIICQVIITLFKKNFKA